MDRHTDKVMRGFIKAGTVAAAIYNVNRDPKKSQPVTAADIFPGIAGPAGEVGEASVAELDMFFRGVAHQFRKNGTIESD